MTIKKIVIIISLLPSFLHGMAVDYSSADYDEIELKRHDYYKSMEEIKLEGRPDLCVRRNQGVRLRDLFKRIRKYQEYSHTRNDYFKFKKGDDSFLVLFNGVKKQCWSYLVHNEEAYGIVYVDDKEILLHTFNGREKCIVCSVLHRLREGCIHRTYCFGNEEFVNRIKRVSMNGREILFECDDGAEYILPEEELLRVMKIPGREGRSVKSAAKR